MWCAAVALGGSCRTTSRAGKPYTRWRLSGLWERIRERLREETRLAAGRKKTPSAAIIDSQSVKTTERGALPRLRCGQEAETGRSKRHSVVDAMGRALAVVVHAADVQNRDGARLVLEKPRTGFARLKLLWADGGYAGELVAWAKSVGKWTLDIVRRNPATHRFEALPHCWIVERTLAWLGRHRRMSKDYEVLPETSETMVRIAMVNLMVHRLHPEKKLGRTGS